MHVACGRWRNRYSSRTTDPNRCSERSLRQHADLLSRSRPSVKIDLKRPDGIDLLLDLIAHADVVVEGYRPGVAERLGFGPDICFERNTQLVYRV